MVDRININPATLSYYVDKSNIPLTILQSKVKNIEDFIAGNKEPTFTQLSQIAQLINVPTGLLLLNKPVDSNSDLLHFRTLNSADLNEVSSELKDTILEMRLKQDFLRGEVEDNLDFIGQFSINDSAQDIVSAIRSKLGITVNYQNKIGQNALQYFRDKINQVGVFVFFNGKVKDNTHRNLNLKEFRGFVLSDEKAPIIFVNQKDTKTGQLFTLIHELVHLFIGDNDIFTDSVDYNPTEALVNKVTAEILAPAEAILKFDDFDLTDLAREFPVSKFVLARRLLDLGILSKTEYKNAISRLEKEFSDISKPRDGGNYNNNLKFRMDRIFFRYVENAIQQNRISYTDAFSIIGVGYKGYKTLTKGN